MIFPGFPRFRIGRLAPYFDKLSRDLPGLKKKTQNRGIRAAWVSILSHFWKGNSGIGIIVVHPSIVKLKSMSHANESELEQLKFCHLARLDISTQLG